MFKVISVVGNRPHFIKLAPVSKALREIGLNEVIVHTGQHYDDFMSSNFIKELGIPEPHYNLNVGSERPLIQMAKIMKGLDEVFQKEKPDLVLVYGDTNSTSAGAIATVKSHVPLAHVESGLREYSLSIPEEVNKLLTDAAATLYFSPTQTGVDNLKKQGLTQHVYNTGDVGLDLINQNEPKIVAAQSKLDKLHISKGEYVFMTCHRASNTNNIHNLQSILKAANQLEKTIVFPIHPRTKSVIADNNLQNEISGDNWKVIKPIGFFETQALIQSAAFTLTDSGGVIKESYFHKTPCIIIDKQTEWLEAVNEGWCTVCGPESDKILQVARDIVIPEIHHNSLGDGTASKQIAEIVVNYLKNQSNGV